MQSQDSSGQGGSVSAAPGYSRIPTSLAHPLFPHESSARRILCFAMAMVLIALFFWATQKWWVPAHGGVDQNGYLVGGKQLAETGSMALRPRNPTTGDIDPFQFVGRMWVGADLGTPNERYYPKYPVGMPLLVAACLKLGGPQHGVTLAYLISPVGMVLGGIACYLLSRLLVGSVAAIFCLIAILSSPAVLQLVNVPNSHGSTFGLVAWGMYFVFSWWQRGGRSRAIAAGLLCGAAVSIRYTEGLLVLPIGAAMLLRLGQVGFRCRHTWGESAMLFLAWLAPVAALLLYNRHEMGVWTGYGPTNESTGFAWRYFAENWDTVLRTLYLSGLGLLFPLALGGLVAAWWWNRGAALLLGLWVLPGLFIYTIYYWAPDANNVGYARFFQTLLPAMAPAAAGFLLWPHRHGDDPVEHQAWPAGRVYGALAPLLLFSAALGIENSIIPIHATYAQSQNIRYRTLRVGELCPSGSTILSDDAALLHHLQFVSNYHFYTFEYFNRTAVERLLALDASEPQGLDPARARYLAQRVTSRTQAELDRFRDDIALGAIARGQHVYLFTGGRSLSTWRRSQRSLLQLQTLTQEADLFAAPRRSNLLPARRPQSQASPARSEWQLAEVVGKGLPEPEPPIVTPPPRQPRPGTRPASATTQPAKDTRSVTQPAGR